MSVIEEVIFNITGQKGITGDTDFIKDLGLNSFDIVNIIGEFEDRFAIRIPTREIWQLHTVSDLIGYLQKKGVNVK